jgi:hypothetical protein
MRLRTALPTALGAAALAACSQQADEQAAPMPSPNQAAQGGVAAGTQMAVGEWLIEENANGASARFREQSGADALVLTCDRANRALSLSRAGTAAQPQRFRITIGAQKADVMLAPGGALGLSAQVDGAQPIFAAFTDPATAIGLTGPGAGALLLPGNPGIGRVLAACA